MITVEVIPEGKRKVTMVFEDQENDIGVVEVIKAMAHYIQMLVKEHKLPWSEVAISPGDKVEMKKEF